MPHRIYIPELAAQPQGLITITGEEAQHALRVKRLEAGEAVEVCDGQGAVAFGRIGAGRKERGEWAVDVAVERVEVVPAEPPYVSVSSAVPKGDRLHAMIEGLSQVGAAGWRPIKTLRGVVDPREGKLERLERVATEAMKQCGRASRLEILPPVPFKEAVNSVGRVVIADASGGEYEACGFDRVVILVGPEGGWEKSELEFALGAGLGVKAVRFGPYVMRTEVAAVVAAAQVLSAERAWRARAV
jgi:16S rRNA (uracil1498-N3)-methyltransferase